MTGPIRPNRSNLSAAERTRLDSGAAVPLSELERARQEAENQRRRLGELDGQIRDSGFSSRLPHVQAAMRAEFEALKKGASARDGLINSIGEVRRLDAAYGTALAEITRLTNSGAPASEIEAAQRTLDTAARNLDIAKFDLKDNVAQVDLNRADALLAAATAELASLSRVNMPLNEEEMRRWGQVSGNADPGSVTNLTEARTRALETAQQATSQVEQYNPTAADRYEGLTTGPVDLASESVPVTSADRPPSGGPGAERQILPDTQHVLTENDSLAAVARDAYGLDFRAASLIAYANNIADPARVQAGMPIDVPNQAWMDSAMSKVRSGEIQIGPNGEPSGDLPPRPAEMDQQIVSGLTANPSGEVGVINYA